VQELLAWSWDAHNGGETRLTFRLSVGISRKARSSPGGTPDDKPIIREARDGGYLSRAA
jgi:hypothetical protein